ncbi:hypothetical protein GCM10009678_18910 [Actinomadura kijaniata]
MCRATSEEDTTEPSEAVAPNQILRAAQEDVPGYLGVGEQLHVTFVILGKPSARDQARCAQFDVGPLQPDFVRAGQSSPFTTWTSRASREGVAPELRYEP